METFSRGTLEPAYVTGFVDAAGSFTYSRSGRQLALYFAIKLPTPDRPLLEAIQSFFGGIGKIYEVGASATKRAAYFRVSHRNDLPHVIEHFDSYPLRTAKLGVYEIWRSMVVAKQQFRKPDREQLDALAEQLSNR